MKPSATDDVFSLMDAYVTSAALNAALELGLFWILADEHLDVHGVARALGIPTNRCQYWLQLLHGSGLIEMAPDGYAPSAIAEKTIIEAFSQDAWAYLAGESHASYPALHQLAQRLQASGKRAQLDPSDPDDYFTQISRDPVKARRFTRMLYEIHLPLADAVADGLELGAARRVLDLGGGSGVISQALLRRDSQLAAVVVDVANVCAVGRGIAAENDMMQRLSFHAANLLHDELPAGFDLALLCDVGLFQVDFFRKIRAALNPGGRLVIIDQFAPESGVAPLGWLEAAFITSLDDPDFSFRTVQEVGDLLEEAGFGDFVERNLPVADVQRWSKGWRMIEAHA